MSSFFESREEIIQSSMILDYMGADEQFHYDHRTHVFVTIVLKEERCNLCRADEFEGPITG